MKLLELGRMMYLIPLFSTAYFLFNKQLCLSWNVHFKFLIVPYIFYNFFKQAGGAPSFGYQISLWLLEAYNCCALPGFQLCFLNIAVCLQFCQMWKTILELYFGCVSLMHKVILLVEPFETTWKGYWTMALGVWFCFSFVFLFFLFSPPVCRVFSRLPPLLAWFYLFDFLFILLKFMSVLLKWK